MQAAFADINIDKSWCVYCWLDKSHHDAKCRDRFAGVKGCVVQYNKGEKSLDELTFTSVPLSYSQKPAIFSAENEFRFVVCYR